MNDQNMTFGMTNQEICKWAYEMGGRHAELHQMVTKLRQVARAAHVTGFSNGVSGHESEEFSWNEMLKQFPILNPDYEPKSEL